MGESSYVFESGEPVITGVHGDHSYTYVSGNPLTDKGVSSYVFESGTGIGGESAKVTISDSTGQDTGDVTIISRNETVENYYGYNASGNTAAAEGNINDYLDVRYTVFYIFENADTGEYSFGWVHDEHRPNAQDCGGNITYDMSGVPSVSSYVVRDDDPGNDTYSLSPPSGNIEHLWGGVNTDGVAIGKFAASDLQDQTVAFDVTKYTTNSGYVPGTVRFAGDGGTTVERSYDSTNTTVEIQFGSAFGQ